MQDYVCLMRKLLKNGILTEKGSFTLMNAEEAEHISLPFYGTLIITVRKMKNDRSIFLSG